MVVVAIALGIAWEGSAVKAILQRAFTRELGGAVAIERVHWTAPDTLRLDGVTLDAPGWTGPAARIGQVASLEADIDVAALLLGRVAFNSLVATGVEVTITEDPDRGGALNVSALDPVQGDGGNEPIEVLHAHVGDITIRRGILVHGQLEIDQSQTFSAVLSPDPHRAGWTSFDLRAEGSRTALTGSASQRQRSLVANLQELEALPTLQALLPRSLRTILDLNPAGSISSASVQVSQATGVSAQVTLKGLALDLPSSWVPGGWARYESQQAAPTPATPTLTLEQAQIRYARGTATVSNGVASFTVADGSAAPFKVSFSGQLTVPSDLAGGHDLLDAFAAAPFELEAHLERVRYGSPGSPSRLLLPMDAARVLGFFNLEQVDLSIDAKIARRDAGASVQSDTTISIENGTGAFHLFTYRLHEVEASVAVHADRADILHLRGKGADGAPVTITGSVAPLIDNPGVQLTLSTPGITVDEAFVSAFLPRPRLVFETLMDLRAWRSLADAGLVDDGSGRCAPGSPRCTPGGRVSFDLAINREPGEGKPEVITGRVNLHSVDLVLSFLPLPVRVLEGSVELTPDAVHFLGGGLAFEEAVPDGGRAPARGLVSGSIAMPRAPDAPLEPDLRVACTDLPITPLLLACLPHEDGRRPDGWPGHTGSVAARVLHQLGARGEVSVEATVTPATESGRDIDFDFSVRMNDCAIDPTQGGGESILPWPSGLILDKVTGILAGSPSGLQFRGVEARRGAARCRLDGTVDFVGGIDLAVESFGLELEPWILDGLDEPGRSAARAWWERFSPVVRVDGGLAIAGSVEQPRIAAWARPTQASVVIEGTRSDFSGMDGMALWSAGALTCTGLRGHSEQGWADSCVDLEWRDGALDGSVWAEGIWTTAPLVREAMALVAPGVLGVLSECALEVRVGLHATVRGAADALAVEGVVHPESGWIGQGDRLVPVAFDPASAIRFDGTRVTIDFERTRVAGGSVGVAAVIDPSAPDVLAQVSCSTALGGSYPGLESIFGASAARVLAPAQVEWSALTIDDLEIISRPDSVEPGLIVRGAVRAEDASCVGVAPVTGATGTAALLVESRPNGVGVTIDGVAPTLSLLGRPLTGGSLALLRPSGASRIEIDRWGVAIGAGSGSGSGWVEPGGSWHLDAELFHADLWALAGDLPGSRQGTVNVRAMLDGSAEGRLGRGTFDATGMVLGDGSLGLGLLQLAQFSLPGLSHLDTAKGAFTLDGDRATVSDLSISGGSLALEGGGTVNLVDSTIDLLLGSRTGLPVLGQVLGRLGDAFLRIRVTGTLSDPKPSLERLVGPERDGVPTTPPSVGTTDTP